MLLRGEPSRKESLPPNGKNLPRIILHLSSKGAILFIYLKKKKFRENEFYVQREGSHDGAEGRMMEGMNGLDCPLGKSRGRGELGGGVGMENIYMASIDFKLG